jgi:hypothetical protein
VGVAWRSVLGETNQVLMDRGFRHRLRNGELLESVEKRAQKLVTVGGLGGCCVSWITASETYLEGLWRVLQSRLIDQTETGSELIPWAAWGG